jgi:hypothetical protein
LIPAELWVDADALFLRFDCDIAREIDGLHDLYLVRHDVLYLAGHDVSVFPTLVPNTGVMLVRNSAWSRDLFARLWSMEQYASSRWWENAALINVLGYYSLLGEGPDAPDEDVLQHIRFLGKEWNFIPPGDGMTGSIIQHYAGYPNRARKRLMSAYALTVCCQAIAQCRDLGSLAAVARHCISMAGHAFDLQLRYALRRHPSVLALVGRPAFD